MSFTITLDGNDFGVRIFRIKFKIVIFVSDGKKVIGKLELRKVNYISSAYAVEMIQLLPQYMGFGIGQALYYGLIIHEGISIISDD